MSPFSQETLEAHSGGLGEAETEDQCGVPERLEQVLDGGWVGCWGREVAGK